LMKIFDFIKTICYGSMDKVYQNIAEKKPIFDKSYDVSNTALKKVINSEEKIIRNMKLISYRLLSDWVDGGYPTNTIEKKELINERVSNTNKCSGAGVLYQALDKVATMSGGEKARLVLALIVLEKPQLLLLDEPTNHLDLEMRQALVLALQDFDGAIILIAHDRYLLESCVDEFYLVANGRVTDFDGDIDDYQQWLNDDKKQTVKANKIVSEPQVDKKQQRKEQAELRKKASPLRKQADKFEKLVQNHQDELTEVEAKLADSDIYQAEHKAKLTDLLKRQAKIKQDLEAHEMQWLDLEEQIEEIMSQAL